MYSKVILIKFGVRLLMIYGWTKEDCQIDTFEHSKEFNLVQKQVNAARQEWNFKMYCALIYSSPKSEHLEKDSTGEGN